jgi:hypothetical protein
VDAAAEAEAAMTDIDMPRSDDLFARLRELVEEGAEDQPVLVRHGGAPCLRVRSLHAAALLRVDEGGTPRFAAWTPHPKAPSPGPRIAALLAAREAAKARKASEQIDPLS